MRPVIPAAVLCLGLIGSLAEAGVPDPQMSTIDPCLVVCPSADAHFVMVVRDAFANPIANSTVVIDFSLCPAVDLCATEATDPYIVIGRRVIRVTDAAGRVDFPIRAGGVCIPGVTIQADGVTMGSRAVASFDQDGNLLVDAVDSAIAGTKVGTNDPTADFDCDHTVTQTEVALILNDHEGHRCERPTPARPGSWGRLKSIYR